MEGGWSYSQEVEKHKLLGLGLRRRWRTCRHSTQRSKGPGWPRGLAGVALRGPGEGLGTAGPSCAHTQPLPPAADDAVPVPWRDRVHGHPYCRHPRGEDPGRPVGPAPTCPCLAIHSSLCPSSLRHLPALNPIVSIWRDEGRKVASEDLLVPYLLVLCVTGRAVRETRELCTHRA